MERHHLRGAVRIALFLISSLVALDGVVGQQQHANQAAAKPTPPAAKKSEPAKQSTTYVLPDAYSGMSYNISEILGASEWKQPAVCVPVPALPSWLKLDCSTQTPSKFIFTGTVPTITGDVVKVYKTTVIDADNKEYHYIFQLTLRPVVETVPMDATAAKAAAAAAVAAAVPPAPPDYSKLTLLMTTPIQEGQNQAAGQIQNPPAGVTLNIQVWRQPEDKSQELSQMPLTNPAPPPATASQVAVKNNSFSLQFPSPVAAGQILQLIAVKDDGTQVKSFPAQTVSAAIPIGDMAVSVQEPVAVGATKIVGRLSRMPVPPVAPVAAVGATPATYGNYPGIVVWVTDPVTKQWSQAAPVLGAAAAQFQSVNSDGSFSVTLPSALKAGQNIRVDAVPPPGRSFTAAAPLPALPAPPAPVPPLSPSKTVTVIDNTSLIKPAISSSPFNEGTTVITGNATPPQNNVPLGFAVLRVKTNADPSPPNGMSSCLLQDTLDPGSAGKLLPLTTSSNNTYIGSLDATTGNFKVTLARALKQGEWIQIVQIVPPGTKLSEAEEATHCASKPIQVTYPFDFYRTNLTFVAGVLLSNSSASSQGSANFSQANQFYAFNADHAWRTPGYDCIAGKKWGNGLYGSCPDPSTNRWHADPLPGISTFFEARLTSIPVSTASANPTTTSTGSGSAASSSASTILTSQKVVRFESGIFLPWVIGHSAGEHPNGIFVAPLVKVGFDTVTGATTSSNVILPGNSIGTLNFQSAYSFFVFGGRVGNMALSQSHNRAPQIEHYLDVTVGRYSNLQSLICHTVPTSGVSNALPGSLCASDYPTVFQGPNALTKVYESRKALYRLDFEGLVRVPIPATQIPFYIGFNANIAQHSVGAAYLDHGYAPPDDIRILFGTKIDVGNLLTSLNLGAH